MEPMKPEQKKAVLANRPEAQPSDLQEYERLLSLRYTEDPDQKPTAAPSQARSAVEGRSFAAPLVGNEIRLQELHRKLFGPTAAADQKTNRSF